MELDAAICWENYRARFNRTFAVEAEEFSRGMFCALPSQWPACSMTGHPEVGLFGVNLTGNARSLSCDLRPVVRSSAVCRLFVHVPVRMRRIPPTCLDRSRMSGVSAPTHINGFPHPMECPFVTRWLRSAVWTRAGKAWRPGPAPLRFWSGLPGCARWSLRR